VVTVKGDFISLRNLNFAILLVIFTIIIIGCTSANPNYQGSAVAPPIAITPDPRLPDYLFVSTGTTININGVCEQSTQPLSLWVDGAQVSGVSAECIGGSFLLAYNASLLSEGTHQVYVSISPTPDKVLNSAVINLVKDTFVPVVMPPNLNELATNGSYVNSTLYTVNWTEADGTGSSIDHYDLEVYKFADCSNATGRVTYSGLGGSSVQTLVSLVNSYRLVAQDMAGNQATSVCSNNLYFNQMPVAVTDHIYIHKSDNSSFYFNIISNDSDPESTALQLLSVDTLPAESKLISLVANPPTKNNHIQLQIKPGSRGSETINYLVQDMMGQTSSGAIKIHIVGRNTWLGNFNSDWSEKSNWCGTVKADHKGCNGLDVVDALPDQFQDDPVEFTDISGDCDINQALYLGAMLLDKDFLGRVRQNSNFIEFVTRATSPRGLIQRGGTFEGSGTGEEIHMDSPLEIYGGTFLAPTGALTIESNFKVNTVDNPIVFNNRMGAVDVKCYHGDPIQGAPSSTECQLDIDNNVQFYNLKLNPLDSSGIFGSIKIASAGVHAYGNLSLDTYFTSVSNVSINGGIIYAHKDLTIGNVGVNGTSALKILGEAVTNHLIYGPNLNAVLPNTIIDTGGTLSFNGHFRFLKNPAATEPFFIYKRGTIPSGGIQNFYFECPGNQNCNISLYKNLFLDRIEFERLNPSTTGQLNINDNGFKIVSKNFLNFHFHSLLPINGGVIEAQSLVQNDTCDYGVAGTVQLHLTGDQMNVSSTDGCTTVPSFYPATLINSAGTIELASSVYFGATVLDGSKTKSDIFTLQSGVISSDLNENITYFCSNGLDCRIDTGSVPLSIKAKVLLDARSSGGGDTPAVFTLNHFEIASELVMIAPAIKSNADLINGDVKVYKNVAFTDYNLGTNIYFNNPISLIFKGSSAISITIDNFDIFPASSTLDFGVLTAPSVTYFGEQVNAFDLGVILKNDTMMDIPDGSI
jgi:hypothetical protein